MAPTGKKRVCCFCEKWESGGIESFLCNILLHMDLSDLEVDIVASQLADSVFTEPLKALGIRFVELSGSQRNLPKNHALFRQLLRQRQYDVVHLNVFQGLALYYGKIAAEEGVPVRIAHSHNTDLRQSRGRQLKLCLHRWGRNRYKAECTELWACSQAAAEFLFGEGKAFRFIPNGIETERFRFDPEVRARIRGELGSGNALVVGNVGRLCSQKNQSFLLDVFQKIQLRESDSRLLLVGEGEDLPALKEKAKGMGLLEKVLFYGVSDRVEQLFWAMDVFVFPSLFEGLGIVAIEAQAAGLPVVASENVPKEACVSEAFKAVPLADGAEAWAEAVLRMKAADRGHGGEMVAEAGFDVRTVAEQIKEKWIGR